jgi:lipopolysaccharide/colanic/teichoic acid biosynthesis glycosyltransferase
MNFDRSGVAMDATAAGGGANREFETVARVQHRHGRNRSFRRPLVRGQAEIHEPSRPARVTADTYHAAAAPIRPARPELLSSAYSERANRALNILVAIVALVVLAPVILLIALAVKLTSRGPILYAQVRVGVDERSRAERRARADRRSWAERGVGFDRRGRPTDRRASASRRTQVAWSTLGRRTADVGGRAFRIYKFRSMCVDAECGTGAVWATRKDPRVTPIGRFLRHFRLDELPQLYNVLKGDMNIVGPRPERPSIFWRLRDEIPEYPLRQRTRPGITGWAQVKHTYDSCIDDVRKKVRFDLEYLQRRNLWVDLKIIARTIPVMLFKRGAC